MGLNRLTSPLLALALGAAPAFADVFVVDDDGGPGVDFTDIAAAIEAAADGDVLRVRAGQYGNFFVNGKGLTLVGEEGAILGGDCIISDLSSDQLFSISAMEDLSIWFDDCEGTVVLDQVTMAATCCSASLIASGCADLRLQRSILQGAAQGINEIVPGFEINDSLVQISGCTILGQVGIDPNVSPTPGGAPALLLSSSRVHLAQTAMTGGTGGTSMDCIIQPGAGGAGIQVTGSDSSLIVAGPPRTAILGGHGGISPAHLCDGAAGNAVHGTDPGSSLRISGVRLIGGMSTPGQTTPPLDFAGTIETPDERDPTLRLFRTPFLGQQVPVRINGEPFSDVYIMVGAESARIDDPNSAADQLTTEERVIALGTLGRRGKLVKTFVMPTNMPVGETIWVQAATVSPSGDFERSNSVTLILR
ncbi:MAG: hypothetical protein ACI8QZ_003645 [Chlamydiales bacterium]|jgi:hypothetical protein